MLRSSLIVSAFVMGSEVGFAMENFPMPIGYLALGYRERVEQLIFNVNLLHIAGYDFDELPSDVRAIYYSDFVLLELLEAGTVSFVQTQLPLNPATERDITDGLVAIGANELSGLYRRYFIGQKDIDPDRADRDFAEVAKRERVEALADGVMLRTRQIEWKPESEVAAELADVSLNRRLSISKEN